MATVGSLVVRIGADVSGLDKALQTAQGKLRAAGAQMKQLGAGLTLGVSAPLGALAVGALNSAADFESAMNMMQAVSGATGNQMESLSAQALEMGRVTSFSAGQAAQAQLELAKSGMTAEQVMGALPGVLDLAAAGGLDLANAAEIASNTLNAFGLPAAEAATVANTLAAAANASSIEVTDLADGMKMAGSVFASNGQSVETLATAMAVLGNNAIKGSDAGTSLKTMMMRLAAPTKEGAGAMAELGISVYDAQGKMVPFEQVIGSLQKATAGLSDEQRNSALNTIFGADAIRSASILIGEGTSGWDEMAASVEKGGAASALAKARMKGLGGALQYFKGTLDSVMIQSASPFLDTTNGMVRGAADLIAQVTTLPAPVQQFGAVLLAVAAAAGPLLIILGTMTSALAGLMSPIGLAIAGIMLLGAAFASDFMGVRTLTMQVGQLFATFAKSQSVVQAWQRISQAVGQVVSAVGELFSGNTDLGSIAGKIGDAVAKIPTALSDLFGSTDFGKLRDGIVAALGLNNIDFSGVLASVQAFALNFAAAVTSFDYGGAFDGLKANTLSAIQAIDWTPVATGFEALKTSVVGAVTSIDWGGALVTAGSFLDGLKTGVVSAITSIDWAGILTAAGDIYATYAAAVVGLLRTIDWGGMLATAGDIYVGYAQAVVKAIKVVNWSGLAGAVAGAITAIDWGRGITIAGNVFINLVGAVVGAVTTIDWSGALANAGAVFNDLRDKVVSYLTNLDWTPIETALAPLKTKIDNALVPLQTSIEAFDPGKALASVGDQINKMRDDMLANMTTVVTTTDWTAVITGMIDSLTAKIAETDWSVVAKVWIASLAVALQTSLTAMVWVMSSENWNGFASAVMTSLMAIDWSTVGASLGGLRDAIAKALGEFASGLTEGFKTPVWLSELLGWKWPSLATLTDWKWPALTDLLNWKWPSLPEWTWPKIGVPDWVNWLMSFNPFGGGTNTDTAHNALGTPRWPGGYTWLNENGPETVWLPSGSVIAPASKTAGGQGGVVIQQVTINTPMDLEELRWKLTNLTRRRG